MCPTAFWCRFPVRFHRLLRLPFTRRGELASATCARPRPERNGHSIPSAAMRRLDCQGRLRDVRMLPLVAATKSDVRLPSSLGFIAPASVDKVIADIKVLHRRRPVRRTTGRRRRPWTPSAIVKNLENWPDLAIVRQKPTPLCRQCVDWRASLCLQFRPALRGFRCCGGA